MKIEHALIGILAALAVGFFAATLITQPNDSKLGGGDVNFGSLEAATTSSAVAVTTSTRILATTTNALGNGTSYTRVYAQICNPSAVKVLISMNKDVAADGRTLGGYWLDANSCFEITERNQYNGSVTASTSDQSSVKVLVTDYVQL